MYDIEKGYVKIANELIEDLARLSVPGNCYKVILWAIRNSYGYNKKNTGPASIKEIAEALEISKSSAQDGIKVLLRLEVLKKLKNGEFFFNKSVIKNLLTVRHTVRLPYDTPYGLTVRPTVRTVRSTVRLIYIRRKDNLKTGEGRGRENGTASNQPASPFLEARKSGGKEGELLNGKIWFPEEHIFKLGEAYIKAKKIKIAETAKATFLKRSKIYYSLKDLLTLAEGNVDRAIEAITDLADYYGDKDWTLSWIVDKDYSEWDKERENHKNAKK